MTPDQFGALPWYDAEQLLAELQRNEFEPATPAATFEGTRLAEQDTPTTTPPAGKSYGMGSLIDSMFS